MKIPALIPFTLGLLAPFAALAQENPATATTSATDDSPWGIASGAEWAGDYPKFNPMLKGAGVTWMRYFPEWQSLQPAAGEWKWEFADDFVANSKANGIQVAGVFGFAAKFATTDGSTRRVPLKDNQLWRDYVEGVVTRYHKDVKYWEIWNEFNGSFSVGGNPKIYADLVKDAYTTARKVDPEAKIGLSVANFDVGFLDATIKAGSAGHFDYVAVHPYENLGALARGQEMGYLSLAGSLRKMLKDNGQPENTPLWITEIGTQSTIAPNAEKDAEQADSVVMCYVLSLAQGFDKVFWFEARGPAYGKGTDHGIIRKDWSPRPVYHAFANMTKLLGPTPDYLGWLDVGEGAFGFAFQGAAGPVLVTWSPLGAEGKHSLNFNSEVKLADVLGQVKTLPAKQAHKLQRSPIYVGGLPEDQVALAKANKAKPFPWGVDYSKVDVAASYLGATNRNEGVEHVKTDTTEVVHGLDWSARRSKNGKGGEGAYTYFRVDPTFAGFGNSKLEITVVARRHEPQVPAGFSVLYESLTGYKAQKGARWEVSAGEEWVEHTWTVDDANFVGAWGWNFRMDANGSKGEVQYKEVRVRKLP